MIHGLTQLTYLAAAALFILSLRWLSHPKTARRGVAAGVGGMTLAIVGTLFAPEIVNFSWIAIAAVVGIAIGVPLSWVPLTAVPQRTSVVACVSAGAAGTSRHREIHDLVPARRVTKFRTGAIVTRDNPRYLTSPQPDGCGEAPGVVPTRPITYPIRNVIKMGCAIAIGGSAASYLTSTVLPWAFALIIRCRCVRGAADPADRRRDMPTVISLLNSYAGLSAVAMASCSRTSCSSRRATLDGSSGLIMSISSCAAR